MAMEDSMTHFDLDLLLGPAPTSTENTSTTEDVFLYHNFNPLEGTEQFSVQNERKAETTVNYKDEYLKTLRCLEEKSKEYDKIKKYLEKKTEDYDQLKEQFIKLGKDFAYLHYESKEHALDAINANNCFEKINEELKICHHKLIAAENQYTVTETMHKAAMSHNNQLSKLVEKLENDAANFKNMTQSYKDTIKEERRKNSTLKNKYKIYEKDLFSIAGKLERATDKKNRDHETELQIKKYTSKKFNTELENIDNQSIDTGRGSSFSMYSPAYSINFSPLNITDNFEQKIMKDASTSTLHKNDTVNLSKYSISSPKIFEVSAELLDNISVNIDSSKKNIKTVDTASSPISFVDVMEKITTVDTASSPISFVDVMEKITTVDTASSPIPFVDVMEKKTTVDSLDSNSFSGIRSPVAKANVIDHSPNSIDVGISPIHDAEPSSPAPMSPSWEITLSPIEFMPLSADVEIPVTKITDKSRPLEPTTVTSLGDQITEITRLSKCATVSRQVVQTPDITKPMEPTAATDPVVQTPHITRTFKPDAVTSPEVQRSDMTAPQKLNPVTSPMVQTPEITTPLKPAAVTTPEVQTPEMIRPSKSSSVTRQVVQTPDITKPVVPTAATNPVVKTPHKNRTFKPDAVTSPEVQIPDMTEPQKLNPVTSSVVQTSEITMPLKPAAVTNPVIKTPEITRPLHSADVVQMSIDKTPEINRLLDPTVAPRPTVKTPDITIHLKPTAVTKHADLLTGSNGINDVKRQSLITKTSEMGKPVETTDFDNQEPKNTTSEQEISLINNRVSVISKTPDLIQLINADNVRMSVIKTPSGPMKNADARRLSIETNPADKTNQNEKIKSLLHEKGIAKNCKEIQNLIAQNDEQERDDLEVRMILNKCRLDWNALSPMSITPDLDEECLPKSVSDVRNDETERPVSENSRSLISKESGSLLLITPDKKKLTLPRNKSNSPKHKINKEKRSHAEKKNKAVKPHSIPSITLTPVHNENQKQSNQPDQKMQLRKRETAVKITPHYKKISITHNKCNTVMHKTNKDNPSHNILKKNKTLKRHSIPPIRHTPVHNKHKRQSTPSDKKMQLRKRVTAVKITPDYQKSTIPQNKSNTRERKRNEDNPSYLKEIMTMKPCSIPLIRHTIPVHIKNQKELTESDEKMQLRKRETAIKIYKLFNSLSHTSKNQITESPKSPESNKKENLLKEKQIENIVSSPERRESARIKSTILAAQSKTKSVPQTRKKLQSNPIDNISNSKEPQSNTSHDCLPIISNPEFGRKRTICRSMEAQSINKRQKTSECETTKPNCAEIGSEDNFTYSCSKLPKTRVSRVKANVSSNTINAAISNQSNDTSKPNSEEEICGQDNNSSFSCSELPKARLPTVNASVSSNTINMPNNNKSENISKRKNITETITKDLGYSPALKRAKLADDKTGFIKEDQNLNDYDKTKTVITHANNKNSYPETDLKSTTTTVRTCSTDENNRLMAVSAREHPENEQRRYCQDYTDMNIFDTHNNNVKTHINKMNKNETSEWTQNLLHRMIHKYGSQRKYVNKTNKIKKEKCEEQIAKQIEKAVAKCVNVSTNPGKYNKSLEEAVSELENHSDIYNITGGLIKYLRNNDRKAEFLPANKNRNYSLKPTPTKYIMVLMQIIDSVDKRGLKLWDSLLDACRYVLFTLDKEAMPSMDVVESVTHLYVYMCIYHSEPNSIILFMLSALYCSNYRAIMIIKNCLDLVPEILPHANYTPLDGLSPLLQTFMFLLHFYTCDDFDNKVQNFRYSLKIRYGYDSTQENDTTMLFKLKQYVININDYYLDKDMLDLAFLILAKRKGTKWCHKNLVQKILIPIIRGEINVSMAAFRFSISIITKLIKPYNNEMTIHILEVVNLLMSVIKQPHPPEMIEDIVHGLLVINIKGVCSIQTFLASWNPPSISRRLEEAFKEYIQSKPLKYWKSVTDQVKDHVENQNRQISTKGYS